MSFPSWSRNKEREAYVVTRISLKDSSLLTIHLIFSGALPIYQANVYIREQSVPKGKTLSTCLHHCATMVCLVRLTDRNIPFCQTLSVDLQHPFYPFLSLYFLFFIFLFLRKDAIHLKITCWKAGCSSTACSQFHIYPCLWGIKTCHVVSSETCPILLFITSCMPGCLKKTPLLNSSSQSDNISLWKVNILSLFRIQLYSGLSLHGMQVLYLGYIKLCFNNIHWLFFYPPQPLKVLAPPKGGRRSLLMHHFRIVF